MSRSGGAKAVKEGIAELFAASVDDAVMRVLRDRGKALVKAEILDQLTAAGVPRSAADDAWTKAQKRLRMDSRIVIERDGSRVRYRWNPQSPTPLDALGLLADGRLSRGEREMLAEVLRTALANRAEPVASSASSDASETRAGDLNSPADPGSEAMVPAARVRKVELDAARELVGIAVDVEEQVAKGATAKAVIHRVRARMKRLRLEPTDRAGDTVAFDRTRHQPIRSGIADGAPVLVVRPGYVWRLPGEELLIERPVVQD